jgi:hypothetical protein
LSKKSGDRRPLRSRPLLPSIAMPLHNSGEAAMIRNGSPGALGGRGP